MTDENPSSMLIQQRIRNRVIEYFHTASSYEQQRYYEATVPIANVPNEMINRWEDYVDGDHLDRFWEPVYSPAEQAAIRRFHAVWKSVVDDTPDPLPPLSQLIGTEPWERLRLGAEGALRIFEVRGKLDETCEAF